MHKSLENSIIRKKDKEEKKMKYYAGVDLGGTNTKIGICDAEGKIVSSSSIKTDSIRGVEDTLFRIWTEIQRQVLEQKIEKEDLQGIGIGIPGPVKNQSVVGFFANFPWEKNINLQEKMEKISSKNESLRTFLEEQEREKVRVQERQAAFQRELEEKKERLIQEKQKREEREKNKRSFFLKKEELKKKIEELQEKNQVFEVLLKNLDQEKKILKKH